jgi:hypothetical protein
MTRLLKQLPGTYDNTAQVNRDLASGVATPHAPLQWIIQLVDSPGLGKNAYYARETAADDARRILARRIWTFTVSTDGKKLLQSVYVFSDVTRWRSADDDPSLFQGMLPEDVRALSGCELVWSKTDSGFDARVDTKRCRPSALPRGEDLLIEQRAQLSAETFAVSEASFGADGQLQAPPEADPFDRFQKHAAQ